MHSNDMIRFNPFRNIPSLQTRHMILQITWTYLILGMKLYVSMWIWGFSMIIQPFCIIIFIVITANI